MTLRQLRDRLREALYYIRHGSTVGEEKLSRYLTNQQDITAAYGRALEEVRDKLRTENLLVQMIMSAPLGTVLEYRKPTKAEREYFMGQVWVISAGPKCSGRSGVCLANALVVFRAKLKKGKS